MTVLQYSVLPEYMQFSLPIHLLPAPKLYPPFHPIYLNKKIINVKFQDLKGM